MVQRPPTEGLLKLESDFFKVVVKTNAKKTEYKGWDGALLAHRVDVAAPAVSGKANLEIVKFLSKELKRKVTIVSGASSKIKLLRALHKG